MLIKNTVTINKFWIKSDFYLEFIEKIKDKLSQVKNQNLKKFCRSLRLQNTSIPSYS